MSNVKQVKVGSATFNVAQASAEQQKRLLLLIGSKIAFNSAATKTKKIDTSLLFGAFLSLDESIFDEVANIALCQTVKNGGQELVDIHSFQGDMVSYFELVAKAVEVNLQDFFTYLDKINAGSQTAQE